MAAPIAPPPRPEKMVLITQLLNMSSCVICSGVGIEMDLNLVCAAAEEDWLVEAVDDASDLSSDLSLIGCNAHAVVRALS